MSTRHLDGFLHPRSVALIGATERQNSVGRVLMESLVSAGFSGPIWPVNPKRDLVLGIKTYPTIASLPQAPDLAVMATPPETVPQLIAELGTKGTRAAVVITAGFGEGRVAKGVKLREAMLDAARPFDLRIIGPNCLGIQVPSANLNASFAGRTAREGKVALVAQSGAILTAILDWAVGFGVGFSHVLSLGDMADVDFGDTLELLGRDPHVHAILLYVEAVTYTAKFLSAAKEAAKVKPVIVVKAGRFAEGARAASSHTGALAGSDKVYDAAFRRAGILRVFELEELFEAAEILSKIDTLRGERLAILTNGGGAGVLATDALIEQGGRLATMSTETLAMLNTILPSTWSHANPVDIIGDASAERYAKTLRVLLQDKNVDAVLTLNCPTAVVDSAEVAEALVNVEMPEKKTVIAVWLGGESQERSRAVFEKADWPCYADPASGVRAFMHLVRYRRTQSARLAAQTQTSFSQNFNRAKVRAILAGAQNEKREWLTQLEAKQVLTAYGIPAVHTWFAADPKAARELKAQVSGPVALKISSPDILHKSDVGGVILNLKSGEEVQGAAEAMFKSLQVKMPAARLDGFMMEEMINRPFAYELIVGTKTDPQFGPVILFGEGGTAVELIDDTALDLAPIHLELAHELIFRTRISRRLKGYRDRQAVDLEGIQKTLVCISQLVMDFPEIFELDINPLLADHNGVLAVDARIRLNSGKNSQMT